MVNIFYVNSEGQPPANLTLFAVPKPFEGDIGTIQRNAIASWAQLDPKPEIILFGDEAGTESVAGELGLHHIPQLDRNEYGTPLLDGIFARVREEATHPILAYLNADIILTDDFTQTASAVAGQFPQFLMLGRRWDADIAEPLDFSSNWDVNLVQGVRETGTLATYHAKDYFVFPKSLFPRLPQFAIGRGYWDTWMVETAIDRGYPVVDASLVVSAIHQNHAYNHLRGGKKAAYFGGEAQRNKTVGNVREEGTIAHATWMLKPGRDRDAPQVSVVIDGSSSSNLGQTIESILKQRDVRCEVLLIGDRIQNSIGSLPTNPLHSNPTPVRYVRPDRPGVVTAWNQGLKVARGELILFLKPDGVFLPGTLAKQVACFEREASTLDLVLSGCEGADGEEAIEVAPWHQIPDLEDLHVWKLDRLWQPFSQSAVLFRRRHLAFAGGFHPQLDGESAVIEMILRLVFLRGSRAAWLPQVSCRASIAPTAIPRARQMQAVVDRLFERSEVKPWMHRLKSRASLRGSQSDSG